MVSAIYQFMFLSEEIPPPFATEMTAIEKWLAAPTYQYTNFGRISYIDCQLSTWCASNWRWPDVVVQLFAAAGIELPRG
jgi:hypothetical protein